MVVRAHREKLGDVSTEEGAAVGRWLGVISRAVVGAVRGEDTDMREGDEVDVGDWNVVQNNGPLSACSISLFLFFYFFFYQGKRHVTGEESSGNFCPRSLTPLFGCRRASSPSGAACSLPHHTARGRCAGGESEELDCVWEGPEGGLG